MQITAFGGVVFADEGIRAFTGVDVRGPDRDPLTGERANTPPVAVGVRQRARTLPVQCSLLATVDDTERVYRFGRFLGAIDVENTEPRPLRGLMDLDGDGTAETTVTVDATVLNWTVSRSGGELIVSFSITQPVWRSLTATTEGAHTFRETSAATGDGGIALENTGHARAYPTLTLTPTAQRTTQSAIFGWRFVVQCTVTNNGATDWTRRLLYADLGSTIARVSGGTMQADGDDIRVRLEGYDLPCEPVNVNTGRTFVYLYGTILAGETVTYDILYGNASATKASTLKLSSRGGTNPDNYVACNLASYSGTASAGGANTITATGTPWEARQWIGANVQIISGTGAGQRRRASAATPNTTSVLTVTRAWTTQPDATSVFVIWQSGVAVDGGQCTSGGGATNLTDASQAWGTNQWTGATIRNVTQGQSATVVSNTPTTMVTTTLAAGWGLNDVYYLERAGYLTWMTDEGVFDNPSTGLAQSWIGFWRVNNYFSQPESEWFGDQCPEAWSPWLALDNNDRFAQSVFANYGSGGGHPANWRGQLRARRSVRQDEVYGGAGNGQSLYDGVQFDHPWTLQGVYFDYQWLNERGIGQAQIAVQGSGGQEPQPVVTDTSTQASLTPIAAQWVDLSAFGNPMRIAFNVLPSNLSEIPSTVVKTDDAELRPYRNMQMWLSLANVGGLTNSIFAVSAEVENYEFGLTARIGGGEDGAGESEAVTVGGEQGHHASIPLNHSLVIRAAPTAHQAFVEHYDDTDAFVKRMEWAAQFVQYRLDVRGEIVPIQSREYLPLLPSSNKVSNGSFDVNDTGWTNDFDHASATVAWSRDTVTVYEGAGSFLADITANTAPATTLISTAVNTPPAATGGRFSVVPGRIYEAACFTRATNVNRYGRIAINWYDSSDVYISTSQQAVWTPASTTVWYPIAASGEAPATAAYGRCRLEVWNGASAGTSQVRFDSIVIGTPVLWIADDVDLGTVECLVSWIGGYVG